MNDRGHRSVEHTADLRVEAWGPSREDCLAEAVRGVVEAFTDPRAAAGGGREWRAEYRADSDEDLLVALLDDLVYRLDTEGEVPVAVRLDAVPGGVRAAYRTAGLAALPVTGAAPKAVTLHGLAVRRTGAPGPGWACAVTLDV